jgi:four helix bundle protein
LSKSATSIGANYEESQAASFPEFRQRINICLREARETAYWLRLVKEIKILKTSAQDEKLDFLLKEIVIIQKILGSIASKIQGKKYEK